ncbi:MAG: hypothetical protein JM58_17720 [Peptococcaceae bacterium BICA1-8]|nr:MAG: hypothetical protein JM58_17720 [Peptococcaceae bacterium BICA1-8]
MPDFANGFFGIPGDNIILTGGSFSIKNKNHIWTMKQTGNGLWGRYTLNGGDSWSQWRELITDINAIFSFTISDENKVHLLCQNSREQILYCRWHEAEITVDSFDKRWLIDEKVTKQKIIIDHRKMVYLFLFTENSVHKTWQIKYCCKKNGEWSLPEIIDYGLGPNLSQGTVGLDSEGTIYLIYELFKNGNYQLIYRKKIPSLDRWSDKVPIAASKEINLNPNILIDKKDIIHITWVRAEDMNLRVLYRRKTKNSGTWMVSGWEKERFLSEQEFNCYLPAMKTIEDEVEVYWQQKEGIYRSISQDNGLNFTEPILYQTYETLAGYKHILLDINNLQAFNPESFELNSTPVYLAITELVNHEFENTKKNNMENNIMPNAKKSESCSSIDNFRLYGAWKESHEYLEKINGNFRRLIFEMDELKLINSLNQTINKKIEVNEQLKLELLEKEEQLMKQKEREQRLENIVQKLKARLLEKIKEK